VPVEPCTSSADCDDEDPCTQDMCFGDNCVHAPGCDDHNPCTADTCDNSSGTPECTYDAADANGEPCDDGNTCTTGDFCADGQCLPGTPLGCDDGNPCSEDYCDEYESCSHHVIDCSDDLACTDDFCLADEAEPCQHRPRACQEGYRCVEPYGQCIQNISCTDASTCPVDDPCRPPQCIEGLCTPVDFDCDDHNECTSDECRVRADDGTATCVNSFQDYQSCDDDDACTQSDRCIGGECKPGSPTRCNDGDECTVDSCDGSTGECTYTAVGCPDGMTCRAGECWPVSDPACGGPGDCDDASACTHDFCDDGVCTHRLMCDDSNPCTTEQCDETGGSPECTSTPDPGADCDDNDLCTTNDKCNDTGECAGDPEGCDDGNACSVDSCSSSRGCSYQPVRCDDDNYCTMDSCDPGSGCTHDPAPEYEECASGRFCDTEQDRGALPEIEAGIAGGIGVGGDLFQECAPSCFDTHEDPESCLDDCIRDRRRDQISESCHACFAGYTRCVFERCTATCQADSNIAPTAACGQCAAASGCNKALEQCKGLDTTPTGESLCDDGYDNDLDGERDCEAEECGEDPVCTGAASQLRLNEVDYDQEGADETEFVEIFNSSAGAVDLQSFAVEILDIHGYGVSHRIDLSPAGTLPAGGYLVVGRQALLDTVDNGALEVAFPLDQEMLEDYQAGIRISFRSRYVDGVAYGGHVPGIEEGSPVTTGDQGTGSLSRCPDGHDTDRNDMDFRTVPTQTPGSANVCP